MKIPRWSFSWKCNSYLLTIIFDHEISFIPRSIPFKKKTQILPQVCFAKGSGRIHQRRLLVPWSSGFPQPQSSSSDAADAADAACTAKWMFLWSCERTHFENCKGWNMPKTTTFLISTVQCSWDFGYYYVLRDGEKTVREICMKIQLWMQQDIMKRKDGDTLLARPVIVWS